MTLSLNTIILEPLSKEKPKNAVILCHGYGGDGKDISILASYWRAHLPETIIICPDAPEKCAASPTGFQWFDLMDQSSEQILSKSLSNSLKIIKIRHQTYKINQIFNFFFHFISRHEPPRRKKVYPSAHRLLIPEDALHFVQGQSDIHGVQGEFSKPCP